MSHTAPLKSPYPFFGGKSRAAHLIWQALGDPPNVVEPFFGSGAVLLSRPHAPQLETVNDLNADIPNFWRAMQHDPAGLARLCDTPVSECDLHAFHTWLIEPTRREAFVSRMMGDPDYYDLLRAARWCAGLCMWIGGGWCSGDGPWQSVDGHLVKSDGGDGVHRQLVHLGNAGRGVHRRRVHLGNAGVGVHTARARGEGLTTWFAALQERLRHVRVCCGDWTRVLGPSVTWKHGLTGIVLDPPYSAEEDRDPHIYTVDDLQVAHAVRQWCLDNGTNPLLRIVFCGYGTVHDALLAHGWRKTSWTANGGFGNQRKDGQYQNKYREVLYLSPACLRLDDHQQLSLFAGAAPP
jgi:D12 class N6 adenine-specific DNA methyltransferase